MALPYSSLVLVPALVWVIWSDLLYRRIPNWLVVALFGIWLGLSCYMVALHGMHSLGTAPFKGVVAFVTVLLAGFALFTMGWVGAGDVKLMSVLCLWMGGDAFSFVIAASLIGGGIALAMPFLRVVEDALANGVTRFAAWRGREGSLPMAFRAEPIQGIPYGLAIALGAAAILYVRA